MGGSGGGSYFEHSSPQDRAEAIRREEEKTEDQMFDAQVSEQLGELLADYNQRNTERVRTAITALRKALESELEGEEITPIYGGSVRKHTYVNGISDIDALFVLKGAQLSKQTPDKVLDFFEETIRNHRPNSPLKRDHMAVTLESGDLTLQLLPAVRNDSGQLCIASANGKSWSEIRPESFFKKLSEVNQKQSAKVVPVIKLAKGINDKLPADQQLSGYHIESLAIEAFKEYSGPQNTKAMLQHFFTDAKDRVLRPIKDRTGQSVHVDEYLGAEGNRRRKTISENLSRIETSMRNANAIRDVEKWKRVVAEED
jgi:hypothetical protein